MQTTNPWTAKATRRADYALLSLLATLLSALALAGAALLGNDLIFQAGVTTCLASLATAAAFGGAAAVAWAREETWEQRAAPPRRPPRPRLHLPRRLAPRPPPRAGVALSLKKPRPPA